jgi:Uma2 family endonuclease
MVATIEKPEQITEKVYSPQEYLAMEEQSEIKHEYHQGRIIDMTGGTLNHNKITGNLYAYLTFALRNQPYEIYINDVRLWIAEHQLYTYPDIMLISGEPLLIENRQDTVLNPCLIVEVLSKSTKNYDQGDKFDFYRAIADFQEYILIDQYRCYVQYFRKTGVGEWLMKEYDQQTDTLQLGIIDLQIQLSEIYTGIKLA